MSTLRVNLGVAGLTDVGYRFFTQDTAAAARVDTGIVDEDDGWYSATGVTLLGDHVRWDSTGTADAEAREDLAERLLLENVPTAAAITTAVWAAGTRSLTTFGTLIADIWASATRTLSAFAFTVDTNANATETAIKAKTDQITFSTANRVDSQVFGMQNGTVTAAAIATDAIDNDALAANAISEIQSGLATQTSVDDIPTNAELTTALGTADDAVLARLGTPAGASVSADLADIEGKVDDLESRLGTPSDLGSGATVAANLSDIEGQTDDIGAAGAGLTALATAAELAKVPKSDGTTTWNATAAAQLQSEATDALNAYDPPTHAELTSGLATADDATLAEVALVKAKTDLIPASPAAVGSAMTLASGAITAAVIATDAIDSDAIAASAVTEIQAGLSTYAGGAVASVTGNIGGNVAGSVGSVTADVGITQAGADKVWGSATRTLSSFGTLVADMATAVWAAVTRTLTSGAAPSAASIADAVWDEVAADHLTAGTTGAALSTAGSAGDPWSTDLPNGYTGDQAGAIIGRFNAVAPTGPVTVVPGAPADESVCRVYGYFEDLANAPSSNIKIEFKLNERTPVKSERLITERIITARIIGGMLVDRNDKSLPYQDLQRNDNLTPAGTKYLVNCPELGFVNKEMELEDDLFDLSTLVP